MFIYILSFIISTVATYNAQRCKHGFSYYLHCMIAVIPLALIAALRDSSVGTDTHSYIYIFESAVASNNFIEYCIRILSVEKLFLLYNYIVAQFTSSIEVYFFITYGIIFSLFLRVAMNLKNIISPHIFMIILLLIFYCESLNIMRQYIAISIFLNAIPLLIQKHKYATYIIFSIVACLFHTSAILSFIVGIVIYLVKRFPLSDYKFVWIFVSLFIIIAVSNIGIFLNMGFMDATAQERYNNYLSDGDAYLSSSHVVIYCATLLLIWYKHKNEPLLDAFLLIALFAFIFTFSASVSSVFSRIATYFTIIQCISIAYIHRKQIRENSSKLYINMLLCIYAYYYYFSFVINGSSEAVPYTSKILGI